MEGEGISQPTAAAAAAPAPATPVSPPAPLLVGDKCQAKWRNGERTLEAVVVERRPLGYRKRRKREGSTPPISSSCRNLAADQIEYYVHYENHDRRLDEWITLDKFLLETVQRLGKEDTEEVDNAAEKSAGAAGSENVEQTDNVQASNSGEGDDDADQTEAAATEATNNTINFTVGGNWHGSSGDPALASFEQEHEEMTKVKNVENMIMGEWQVEAWYYSPFPDDYCGLETLYVCEFCLTYMRKVRTYKQHLATCQCRTPPGRRIYYDAVESLSVYELDGKEHRAYCQKLCLLAKLFLDHKTLYYDVNPFYFYVVCRVDPKTQAAHIVGYFSKEKVSSEGYNLACILTFPQYQKAGYGKFIISLSYELTKREGKMGSPEKPLSDLGKVSYRSFWKHILLNLLAEHDTRNGQTQDIGILEMSAMTGIQKEDILSTLQALNMIKVWKGQHVVYVEQTVLQQYLDQKKQFRLCKPDCLDWKAPPPVQNGGNKDPK